MYVLGKGVLGFRHFTPDLHLPACNFLQISPHTSGIRSGRLKALIYPRNHFKSSMSSVTKPIWLGINDPTYTINIVSAVDTNSIGWLGAIRNVFRFNQKFRWLFPEMIPQDWAKVEKSKTRFTWNRDESLMPEPQPSIQATSIKGGQASKHVRHVDLDDPVNEQTVDSPPLVAKAVDYYKLLESTLADYESSSIDLTATPWGYGDVVEYALENEAASGEMLLWKIGCYGDFYCSPEIAFPEFMPSGIKVEDLWEEPIWEGSEATFIRGSNGGEPIFPSRYPRSELQRIERKYGPFLFSCNYLCNPFDVSQSGFDQSFINYFTRSIEGELRCECPAHVSHRHTLAECHVVATVDPAWSDKEEAAESAIVVAAIAPDGCRYLLEAWADRVEPDELWSKLIEFVVDYSPYLDDVGIESVASQKLFKFYFEQMRSMKALMDPETAKKFPDNLRIEDLKPDNVEASKIRRIKAQRLYLAQGQWHFAAGLTKFLYQYSRFPRVSPIDLLDAWSYVDDVWIAPSEHRVVTAGRSNANRIQKARLGGQYAH